MSESFQSARPVARVKSNSGSPVSDNTQIDDNLSMYEVQRLLFDVQSKMEDAVRELASLIDEYVEAERKWKRHEAIVLMTIKQRQERASKDSREKSSQDLREAEVLHTLDEEGFSGSDLRSDYRILEERVRIADRYCRTLEKRGGLLQSLAANLRDVT